MEIPLSRSKVILEQAKRFLPGGVSGTLRALEPDLVFTHASGSSIFDADGKRYLDYHGAFGTMLLGHRHPEVQQRIMDVLAQADLIGIGAHELETQLAEKICQHVPSAEKVIFCNSGTEAPISLFAWQELRLVGKRSSNFRAAIMVGTMLPHTVFPVDGFLQGLRRLTRQFGIVLI